MNLRITVSIVKMQMKIGTGRMDMMERKVNILINMNTRILCKMTINKRMLMMATRITKMMVTGWTMVWY
jgi:hypothetical protein